MCPSRLSLPEAGITGAGLTPSYRFHFPTMTCRVCCLLHILLSVKALSCLVACLLLSWVICLFIICTNQILFSLACDMHPKGLKLSQNWPEVGPLPGLLVLVPQHFLSTCSPADKQKVQHPLKVKLREGRAQNMWGRRRGRKTRRGLRGLWPHRCRATVPSVNGDRCPALEVGQSSASGRPQRVLSEGSPVASGPHVLVTSVP